MRSVTIRRVGAWLVVGLTVSVAQPSSASAADRLTKTYLTSVALDAFSTAYCVSHVGCEEANPLLAKVGRETNAPVMVSAQVASDLVGYWLVRRALERHHHERIAKVVFYTLSAVKVGSSANNLRIGWSLR